MSEITDPIQATPYGIAVAGLLEIEDISEGQPELAPALAVAVRAREEASRVNADHIAAALLPQPDDAPEPAKVIIVTEKSTGDRAPVERRYRAEIANDIDYDGYLRLTRDTREVARYQPAAWLSARAEDATVPDSTKRALGIAKRALEAVARVSDGNAAIQLATDALDEIFAETE